MGLHADQFLLLLVDLIAARCCQHDNQQHGDDGDAAGQVGRHVGLHPVQVEHLAVDGVAHLQGAVRGTHQAEQLEVILVDRTLVLGHARAGVDAAVQTEQAAALRAGRDAVAHELQVGVLAAGLGQELALHQPVDPFRVPT